MKWKVYLIVFLMPVTIISSCEKRSSAYKKSNTDLLDYNNIFCLDLSNDDDPVAKLLIRKKVNDMGIGTMLLPFTMKDIENDPHYYTATGEYNGYSLVYYQGNSVQMGPCEISFKPDFAIIPDDNSEMLDELDKGIYFGKSGLDRKLIYNYALQNKLLHSATLKVDSLNAICVSIPVNSDIIASHHGAALTHSVRDIDNDHYYSGSASGDVKQLRMYYRLQPSLEQNKIFVAGTKLFALIVPFMAMFIFMKSTTGRQLKWRKPIVICLISIEFLCFGFVTYLAFRPGITADAIVDYGLAIIGAVISIITVYFGGKA